MFRLHRYIGLSVLFAAISGVSLFVFVMIAGNALRDIFALLADGQITAQLFFQLFLLLIPYAISFAMPLGTLIGILLVMGRLSAQNEITAMKSAGISLWTITAPVLFVAMLGSMGSIYINSYHAPAARANYKAILNDLVRTDPLRFIVPRTFIHDFPGYVLYAGERSGDRLERFWIWELDEKKRAERLLRADEGYFSYDEDRDSLVLILENGYAELRNPDEPGNLKEIQPTIAFRDAQIRLPLESILGDVNRPRDISQLNFKGLIEQRHRSLLQAEATQDNALQKALKVEAFRAQYNVSKNFAMAFSVFSLALLGIPLGIKVGRTETYANIAVALGIALTYYLGIIIIDWGESSPAMRADLWVWAPNFVCQGLGVYLLFRANRH